MKKRSAFLASLCLILALPLFLLPMEATGAPYLVCDPQAGVTFYKLTGPVWLPTTAVAQPDGSIHTDVGAAVLGASNITLAACKTDPVWGEQCSAFVPFSFMRPAVPITPAGVRLAP